MQILLKNLSFDTLNQESLDSFKLTYKLLPFSFKINIMSKNNKSEISIKLKGISQEHYRFEDITSKIEHHKLFGNSLNDMREKSSYEDTLSHIKDIFIKYNTIKVTNISLLINNNIKKISPFIQSFNDNICSSCNDICCKAEHGYYNFEDFIYLTSLNITPQEINFNLNKDDPCQFLGKKGCSLPREIRPSGCNWYFCEKLLLQMESHPEYTYFYEIFTETADLWLLMVKEFLSYCEP